MVEKISIVVPAYNEEERIGSTLKKIIEYGKRQKLDLEIIVVDDGSTDQTRKVLNSFGASLKVKRHPKRQGKGAAVRTGILTASLPYILFCDADLSTPIEELDHFLPYLDNFDIVIGSRAKEGAKVAIHQAYWKEFLGRLGNKLIQGFLLPGILDTQCGFKLFKENSKPLFEKQTLWGWSFDFEILYLAKKQGFKIKELPVVWRNDRRSKVKPFDYFITLTDLLKIKINAWRGKYDEGR